MCLCTEEGQDPRLEVVWLSAKLRLGEAAGAWQAYKGCAIEIL